MKPRISLPLFFILLFAVSWIGAVPMVLASWNGTKLSTPVRLLQVLMLFGPGLVAVFVTAINEGKKGVRALLGALLKWRVGLHWYLIALLGPLVLFVAARQIALLFGSSLTALKAPSALLSVFASSFVAYLFLNTEELAWRGYALVKLQAKYGAMIASSIVGVLWGVFHLPIFWIKGGHPAGYPFLAFMVMIISMTFIFTWVFNGTKGSVLIVHLLHQSFNSWADAIPFYPRVCGTFVPLMITIVILFVVAILVSSTKRNSPSLEVHALGKSN